MEEQFEPSDVRLLDDKNVDAVKRSLAERLDQFELEEEDQSELVERIINAGRKLRRSDSKKGPKILRLRLDMKRNHILELCEKCSDERVLARDGMIKKMLKRARVVADDDKEYDDEKEEEEEDRESKRRRHVVREGEICPICMEEFFVGSKQEATCMPCSHVFHGQCTGSWLRECQNNCPICRLELPIEHGSQGKQVIWDKTCS